MKRNPKGLYIPTHNLPLDNSVLCFGLYTSRRPARGGRRGNFQHKDKSPTGARSPIEWPRNSICIFIYFCFVLFLLRVKPRQFKYHLAIVYYVSCLSHKRSEAVGAAYSRKKKLGRADKYKVNTLRVSLHLIECNPGCPSGSLRDPSGNHLIAFRTLRSTLRVISKLVIKNVNLGLH